MNQNSANKDESWTTVLYDPEDLPETSQVCLLFRANLPEPYTTQKKHFYTQYCFLHFSPNCFPFTAQYTIINSIPASTVS